MNEQELEKLVDLLNQAENLKHDLWNEKDLGLGPAWHKLKEATELIRGRIINTRNEIRVEA